MTRIDVARIRITLSDLDPAPWREIEMRPSMTLEALHLAIQAVFCLGNYHLWEFSAGGNLYGPTAESGWDRPTVLYRRLNEGGSNNSDTRKVTGCRIGTSATSATTSNLDC